MEHFLCDCSIRTSEPEKAVIEALVVGIIATLATDLWRRLLQIAGVPPANWALGGAFTMWWASLTQLFT
jgi:hypothetical protein